MHWGIYKNKNLTQYNIAIRKKNLFLKQEGKTDIPMPMVYERLPNFCFCYKIIGHQYKECAKY